MDAHPGLAPGKSVLRTDDSTTLSCARLLRNGETNGICTRTTAFTEPDADSYIMVSIWILRPGSIGIVSFTRGVSRGCGTTEEFFESGAPAEVAEGNSGG